MSTFGFGEWTAYVAGRGGSPIKLEMAYTSISRTQVVNGAGNVRINIPQAATSRAPCCEVVAKSEPWRDEVVLYRDNDLAFAGPLKFVGGSDSPNCLADDLFAWMARRIIEKEDLHYTADVADIFQGVFEAAMQADTSPNIELTTRATGVRAVRDYLARDLHPADGLLTELAKTGLDFTMVGRRLVAGGKEVFPTRRANASQDPPAYVVGSPVGLTVTGNIDINHRPIHFYPNGSFATVLSISIEDGGVVIVLPLVSPSGAIWSINQSVSHYFSTGEHLGKFDTEDNAETYAEDLHLQQEMYYSALIETIQPLLLHDAGCISAEPIKDGSNFANDVAVLGATLEGMSEPINGRATLGQSVYGLVQKVVTELLIRDEDSANANARSRVQAMQPIPQRLHVTFSPQAAFAYEELIPGRRMDVRLAESAGCMEVNDTMRIVQVTTDVSATDQGVTETVGADLVPLGLTDEDA